MYIEAQHNYGQNSVRSELSFFFNPYISLQEFFNMVVIFLRLEKIQFGGVHGQPLSDMVEAMFTEFNEQLAAFTGKPEDPLNITNNVSG